MKITLDFLYYNEGFGASDGLRDVKTLEWVSVVECLKGHYIFSLDGSAPERIGAGEFFLTPSGAVQDIIHKVDENGKFECRYVFFTAQVDDIWQIDELYTFPIKLPEQYNRDMHELLARIRSLDDSEYCLRMAVGYQIIDIFLRCGVRKNVNPALEPAVRYIREHLREHIAVCDICRAVSISQAGLFRLFAQHGRTPLAYANSLRIKMAAGMLVRADESIEKTAQECGFESQAYFTRVFKRETGMTPGAYRTRHRTGVLFDMPNAEK